MNGNHYDILGRVCVLGEAGVGKTTFLRSYVDNTFTEEYIPTIGVDFKIKTVACEETIVKLQLWDLAGQARFRAITNNYYRQTNAIILMFDVTNQQSFERLSYWIQQISHYANLKPFRVIVGNKIDRTEERKVSFEEATTFAMHNGIPYFQVSATRPLDLNQVFELVVLNIKNAQLQNPTESQSKEKINLSKPCKIQWYRNCF